MNRNIKKILLLLLCSLVIVFYLFGCSISDEIMTSNKTLPDSVSSQQDQVSDAGEENNEISAAFEESQDGENEDDAADNETSAYTFRNDKLLNQHFEKHGGEFDYATVEEYVQGANNVINDERTLHKIEAEDGDDVYYLEETNEFVVVSTDGYLRTYFKPSAGKKYFDRQ